MRIGNQNLAYIDGYYLEKYSIFRIYTEGYGVDVNGPGADVEVELEPGACTF